ncbi:ABC transporter substrate-binding protein [Tardiphaga sp.]|uniref:ABC transporter substrate-binding protein n=1 Tax=Tardiphaga sp. TaxID=1926292 RepID=UPI00260AE457|nr:ABC transporter substrate-binding protein [Tardiphaga sp.]MDB5618997.1 transporter permease [Tardiphaga sp.]
MTYRTGVMAVAVACSFAMPAIAEPITKPVTIAVLNDKSSVFSDAGGVGGVIAAQLAIDDIGGKVRGQPVVLLGPDHQNKTDIGVNLARNAYDQQGVDAIFDIGNSAISLAVQDLARERGKVLVHVGSATADIFGKACSPTGAMWLYDTYSLAQGIAKAVVQQGGDTWFFITADYAFGIAMQAEVSKVVTAAGGKVLGAVRHPVGTMDFSSFLLQAQSSGAKVIALANASGDTVTNIKQAREFQIGEGKQKLAVLIFYLTSVHALGAEATQGVQYLEGYYWDNDDASRAFGKRFAAKNGGKMPTHSQAGVYSAVLHYLRAVEASNDNDGLTVMRKMKATPVDDFYAPGARIREDGRLMNDMLLAEVKKPSEVKGEWDLLKITGKVKAADIMRPIADGGCTRLDPPLK